MLQGVHDLSQTTEHRPFVHHEASGMTKIAAKSKGPRVDGTGFIAHWVQLCVMLGKLFGQCMPRLFFLICERAMILIAAASQDSYEDSVYAHKVLSRF